MTDPNIEFYGFTPVARDQDVLFENHPTASGDNPKQDLFSVEDFPLPNSPLAQEARAFVKKELDLQTFNHSHRVYYYGTAFVKTHFPTWSYDHETYYLSCLFHDIGIAERFLLTTKLSFEFKGGIVARDFVLGAGGVEDQADSICDAIIRHQDHFVKGNITMLGQILQIATLLDNTSIRVNCLHPKFIEAVCAAYPRVGWSTHFSKKILTELNAKPWCHTSSLEVSNWKEGMPSKFSTDVRDNVFMHKYD